MCGICGVYSERMSKVEVKAFQALLHINVFRGEDSTGIVRLDKGSKKKPARARIEKSLEASPIYVHSEYGRNFIEKPGANTVHGFIGHTRHATKGTVNLENAHPFRFDNVTGVHNGTVNGSFKHHTEYGTDSEAIYRNINDYGIDETLEEIRLNNGAYALVWVDHDEQTLNFCRNSKRPLYFTYIFNGQTLLWSSDKDHLKFVMKHFDTFRPSGINGDKDKPYFTLKPNHVMTIELGCRADERTIRDTKVPEYSTTTTVRSSGGGMPSIQNSNSQYGRDFHRGVQASGTQTTNLPFDGLKGDNVYVKQADGAYRTNKQQREHVAAMKEKKKAETAETREYTEDYSTDELSTLAWLETDLPEVKSTPASVEHSRGHGEAPVTDAELKFKLTEGCFGCGEVFDFEDKEALSTLHWWNRDHHCCDDCRNNVDWVRDSFEEGADLQFNYVTTH